MTFKKFNIVFFIVFSTKLFAQNYLINFTSQIDSQKIDSIKIENYSNKQFFTIYNNSVNLIDEKKIKIFTGIKNKVSKNGEFIINTYLTKDDTVKIILFDNKNEKIISFAKQAKKGYTYFLLTNINFGNYKIKVITDNYSFTGQITSRKIKSKQNENLENKILLTEVNNKNIENNIFNIKYNKGELLQFTAFSGEKKTVVLDMPETDTTISFYFDVCKDFDGNNYRIIKVGNQLWMVDNLKTTHYNNGDSIPNITDNEVWNNTQTGAYRNYFDNKKFTEKYGRYYNWYAVTDSRKLAPKGWRIPDKDDWVKMQNFKNNKQQTSIGNKLKEMCFIPGGYCDAKGGFGNIYNNGYWWLSTANDKNTAWYFMLMYYQSSVGLTTCDKNHGFSVICVKDIKKRD